MVVFRLLHLRSNFAHDGTNFFFIFGCLWHVFLTEFGTTCQDLRKTFNDTVLAKSVMKPGVRIVHNILLAKFGRVTVVLPNNERYENNHTDQVRQ